MIVFLYAGPLMPAYYGRVKGARKTHFLTRGAPEANVNVQPNPGSEPNTSNSIVTRLTTELSGTGDAGCVMAHR